LVPVYGLALFLAYAMQGQRGHHWRAFLESLLQGIPVLGQARRNLAIARLSAALEALLNAGVTVIEAWELAAAASGSPALLRVVQRERANLYSGMMPGE